MEGRSDKGIYDVDRIVVEEIIKNYANVRWKILNLQRVWKKFQKQA